MPLDSGHRLGPYEILAPLGAGGMGEVYKARDTRLQRDVAIKVLPSHVASDPHLRQRFEREARTLGSLSHPHICPIHDVGSVDGTDYLVMELLEGDTVADRLEAGPLPLDKALETAVQIADALDTAHRAGIVHRDLKPGNIMLTRTGATLVDFGLAKARAAIAAEAPDVSRLPTAAPDLTMEGTILGTVQYMAPEQIEGRDADARTDIFALGAVLFEMIAGRRPFEGRTHAALMSAILRDAPPPVAATLAAAADRVCGPGGLHHLDYTIRRCLAKDPHDRWQSARDLMLHLRWIAEGGAQTTAPGPQKASRRTELAAWIVAGTALVATLALGWFTLTRSEPANPVLRFSIDAPIETVFAPTASISAPHPAISPDGRQVAFLAQSGSQPIRLWVRSLDTLEAHPLAGTDGASFPFWSADSRLIGFFAEGALKSIDPGGGAAHRICDAPAGEGGSWNRDGTILFAPGPGGVLHRVPAAGGVSTSVTKPSATARRRGNAGPGFFPTDAASYFTRATASRSARSIRSTCGLSPKPTHKRPTARRGISCSCAGRRCWPRRSTTRAARSAAIRCRSRRASVARSATPLSRCRPPAC